MLLTLVKELRSWSVIQSGTLLIKGIKICLRSMAASIGIFRASSSVSLAIASSTNDILFGMISQVVDMNKSTTFLLLVLGSHIGAGFRICPQYDRIQHMFECRRNLRLLFCNVCIGHEAERLYPSHEQSQNLPTPNNDEGFDVEVEKPT
jgi:hypothetical protein